MEDDWRRICLLKLYQSCVFSYRYRNRYRIMSSIDYDYDYDCDSDYDSDLPPVVHVAKRGLPPYPEGRLGVPDLSAVVQVERNLRIRRL